MKIEELFEINGKKQTNHSNSCSYMSSEFTKFFLTHLPFFFCKQYCCVKRIGDELKLKKDIFYDFIVFLIKNHRLLIEKYFSGTN